MRMLVLDDQELVVNVVEVDDDTWQPGVGLILHPAPVGDDAPPVGPGWRLDGDTLVPPLEPEPQEPDPGPTLEERIAELEARVAVLEDAPGG